MHANLIPLQKIEELDALMGEGHPLLLFKHSYTCGVSAEALDELTDHIRQAASGARYAMLTVQTHRALSNVIAQRFGVRHETPQVLLIHDGRVVWSATHFRVTADAVREALDAVAATR